MCSYIFTIVYGVCILAAGILNIVALVTPNWAVQRNASVSSVFEESWTAFGKCFSKPGASKCAANWESGETWQKAAFICLCVSLCLCALGLLWSVLSVFACCCVRCLRAPLVIYAGLACVSMTTALVLWAVYMAPNSTIGYSMICAIVSAVILLLNTFIGYATIRFTKHSFNNERSWSS